MILLLYGMCIVSISNIGQYWTKQIIIIVTNVAIAIALVNNCDQCKMYYCICCAGGYACFQHDQVIYFDLSSYNTHIQQQQHKTQKWTVKRRKRNTWRFIVNVSIYTL